MGVDSRIIRLEDAFDRGEIDIHSWPEMNDLMAANVANENQKVFSISREILRTSPDPTTQAFVLQWAIATAEVDYDMKIRSEFMRKWNQVPLWSTNSYCKYLRSFHESLSVFFDGSLREAEARFKRTYELAYSMNYARGLQRCLYHLGLVYRDRGDYEKALSHFEQALAIAQARIARNAVTRITSQIIRLNDPNKKVEVATNLKASQIEALLRESKFREAASSFLSSERSRRKKGANRQFESHYMYLPLIARGLGKNETSLILAQHILDPILKIRFYKLKSELFGLSTPEKMELESHLDLHGVSKFLTSSIDKDDIEFFGIPLSSIRDSDIRSLLTLMLNSKEPMTKEQIFTHIWQFGFDPFIHDRKIYKLIHKTKGLFKKSDLFLNVYGAYRINPKYLGKEAALSQKSQK